MNNHSKSGQPVRYARIPEWVLFHKSLKPRAKEVFAALMFRADNDTLECWPSHKTLADDLDTSPDTVERAVGQLEAVGAVIVTRRLNFETGSNISNHYRMVLDPPTRKTAPTPTRKTAGLTTPSRTKPISFTPDGPILDQPPLADRDASASSTEGSATSQSPRDLDGPPRKRVRDALVAVGKAINDDDGYDFHAPAAQQAWEHFHDVLEKETGHLDYVDALLALVRDRWTVTGKVAAPYAAGIELNKMLHSAAAGTQRHLRVV